VRTCEDARVPRPDVILCDLDGTITDSIPGIFRCLRLALPTIGLADLTDEELRTWLGPPLRHTLLEVNGKTEAELDAFVTAYRAEYFGGGEYEFEVFPGMAELISDIGASDTALVLATAKPIESAERVLTKAGLIEHFAFVSGTELDLQRQDKPSVIAHGLESIGVDPKAVDAVMVGDRKEDVLGAQHFGFRSAGVRWGYADEGELEAVGPTYLVEDTDQLRAALGF
jgi:phosphoglycolate phosphatase